MTDTRRDNGDVLVLRVILLVVGGPRRARQD
jgi:hypothetical protein